MAGPGIELAVVPPVLDLVAVVQSPECGEITAPSRGHDAHGVAWERVRPLLACDMLVTAGDVAPEPAHGEEAPAGLHARSEPCIDPRDFGLDDVREARVNSDVSGRALDAVTAAARRAIGVVQHCPGGVVLPRQIRGREPVPVGDEVERPFAGLGTNGAPLRLRGLEIGVAGRVARHLSVVRCIACAWRWPALRDAADIGMVLRRGTVQMVHGGRRVA